MKLLMISPVPIAPTNTGGKVRIRQLATGLARYHHVTLVAPVYAGAHDCADSDMFALDPDLTYQPCHCAPPTVGKRLYSLVARWPYHTALRYQPELAKGVEQAMQRSRYDLIYCHFIQTLPYLSGTTPPLVVDQQNVDRTYWQRRRQNRSVGFLQRWLADRNLQKTIRYETARLPQMSGIVSVSEADRRETQRYAEGIVRNFFVASNGVDPTAYWPSERMRAPTQLVLGFFGSMDLQINQDAAFSLIDQIAPAVQLELPETEVSTLIIGRNPPRKLQTFAQSHPERRISVMGTVPDVLPYLQSVDILVLPLQDGAGTKLRVLEAMAAGICVVGTPLALAGLDAIQSGVHALLATTTEEMVAQICALARAEEWRQAIGKAARRIVTQHYSWTKITGQLASELATIYERGNPL